MSAEKARRWRLILGEEGGPRPLEERDQALERCLAAVYGGGEGEGRRKGGLGRSAPRVARWLGELRTLFPAEVVRVVQRDALDRLGLTALLLEPELLDAVDPDVALVGTLLALKEEVPEASKARVRAVVAEVVQEIARRLAEPLRSAVRGSLQRGARTRRPRGADIDWGRTILANLRHYLPEQRALVPERLVGHARQRRALAEVILLVDLSASMAGSAIYAGIFAAVLASLPALTVRLVVFDTAVADLTGQLAKDPVDLLLGLQLGGGTDIGRALEYARARVERPEDTVVVLISDLHEGGDPGALRRHAAHLVEAGVRLLTLLALDDAGAPAFDRDNAAALAALGVPCFACTPELFPDLMAAALDGDDLGAWAARQGVVTRRG